MLIYAMLAWRQQSSPPTLLDWLPSRSMVCVKGAYYDETSASWAQDGSVSAHHSGVPMAYHTEVMQSAVYPTVGTIFPAPYSSPLDEDGEP